MARSPLLRNQYSLFSTRMRSGRVAWRSVAEVPRTHSCDDSRVPVAEGNGLSHAIVGSTACGTPLIVRSIPSNC